MTRPSKALLVLKQLITEGVEDDDSLYIVYWASRPNYPFHFYKNLKVLKKRFKHAFIEDLPRALIIRGRFVAFAILKLACAFNLNPKIYRLEEVKEG